MYKSIFTIEQMDCLLEEQMVRMKLEGISEIKELKFDIPKSGLLANGL